MTIWEHFKKGFKENIRQYTMLLALVAIWVIMSSLTDGVFISPRNISNLFLQTVTVAIVALGMTLVIVTGNIDLSVGSVAGFTGAVAAVLQEVKYGWSTPGALAAACGAGLVIGAWHGFWVAYRKVPAFIVTLASMLAFRGAILGVTGGSTVSPLNASFKAIGTEYLSPHASAVLAGLAVVAFVLWSLHNRRQRVEYGFLVPPARVEGARITAQAAVIAAVFAIMVFNQGVPYSVLLLLGLALVFSFMAEDTVFGRRLYAIGGNPEAFGVEIAWQGHIADRAVGRLHGSVASFEHPLEDPSVFGVAGPEEFPLPVLPEPVDVEYAGKPERRLSAE